MRTHSLIGLTRRRFVIALIAGVVVLANSLNSRLSGAVADVNIWPAFRGDGTSHTRAKQLPLRWSDAEGVAWRTAIEGRGQSSPVIWNGRIYVTAVTGVDKETLLVSRVDLDRGGVVWTKRFPAARKLKDTDTTSKAAPTPVVNDAGVMALFESGDLIALSHDGELRWQRSLMDDYGDIKIGHQYGSSPVLFGDRLIVFVGHAGPSYLLQVDIRTGATLWKSDRPSVTSWNTPVIGGDRGQEWVAVPTKTGFEAHRLSDGTALWTRTGVTPAPMASATLSGGRLFVPSSTKGGSGALGVGADAAPWVSDEATADFSSPLVVGETAYFVNPVGVLYAADVTTGRTLWRYRLPGANWASPIFDGKHLYFFGVEGKTVLIEPNRNESKVIAENTLSIEGRVYGVAAVDRAIVLRSDHALVKLQNR